MYRRDFLGTSAGAALALVLPPGGGRSPRVRQYPEHPGAPPEAVTLRDPRVRALALTALDAATSAGASYADVRLTYTTGRSYVTGRPGGTVALGLSVRALVHGYWGWAATPYLAASEAPRVGRVAAQLAQGNAARGKPRPIEWGTLPAVPDGTWTTPITRDPFEVAPEEICDWMAGLHVYFDDFCISRGYDRPSGFWKIVFEKQERVFASTEGSYLTQTVYITSFDSSVASLPPAQGGWDYILEGRVLERGRENVERLAHRVKLPLKQRLEIGRYDIIFTPATVATLLAETLAPATEVDRVLGYEANAEGTSYLGPNPLTQLGSTVASPLVTITADRSDPRGLATIRWDDDGVAPDDFTLVKDGVLVDYQTTREQGAWLAPWYQQQGRAVRSHGCAASADALSDPMQHTPNLTLHPGPADVQLEDLIASLDHGLVVDGMDIQMDFQKLNGLGRVGGGDLFKIYEVRHGRRVAEFGVSMGVMFRSPELWKNILALGGPRSLVTNLIGQSRKGEPSDMTKYSLAAVPMVVKQLAVIDPSRKA